MQSIRKRRVFYIAGFDPRGAGSYHRLYAEEAPKQAAVGRFALRTGPRRRESALSTTWRVEHETAGGGTVETVYEFLHWDDIARRHWHGGYVRLALLAFKVYWYWLAASDFLFGRILRLSSWNFVAGIAPALALFLLPPAALAAAWVGYIAGSAYSAQSAWLSSLMAVAAFAAVLAWGWFLDRYFALGWLLRTYAFVIEESLGRTPDMEERIAAFAERIVAHAAACDDDEIIVVGHSVGANVAVSALVKGLALDPQLCSRGRPVGLLTLGSSIPMQGLMPWSEGFRRDLGILAARDDLYWVDVSARQDIASFALMNPVAASGVTLPGRLLERPLVVSGAFEAVLTARTLAWAEWNLFRMHFQYLMAGEIDHPNSYFAVTTDATPFWDRFTGVVDVR